MNDRENKLFTDLGYENSYFVSVSSRRFEKHPLLIF